MSRTVAFVILFCAIAAHTSRADTVPAGPDYPAPGGNGFAIAGALGSPGGATLTYSGFDVVTPGLTNLWHGLWDANSAGAALDGSLDILSFSGVSGATATWDGTTSWLDPDTSTFHPSVPTRLEITISSGPVSWATLPIAGFTFDPGLGAVIDNATGADYSIVALISADTGSGYVPLNTIHQGSGGNTLTSLSMGFYSAVPEPSTLVLAGIGLAVAVGHALRRRGK